MEFNILILFLALLCCNVSAEVVKISYSLTEESPSGTLVGNVLDEAGLSTKHKSDVLSLLQYEFHQKDRRCRSCFSVDRDSGVIQSDTQVDRDAICPGEEKCVLKFSIVIKPVKYMQFIQVEINLLDINDNAPNFEQDSIPLTISEAAAVKSTYILPTASDPDSPPNGVKSYQIVPSNPNFDIKYINKDTDTPEVQLILNKKLDRELEKSYSLLVSCIDGGTPAKTGTMTVIVAVSDYNDNRPVFKNSSYSAEIPENQSPETFVTKVTAVDKDTGLNGQIRYSFDRLTASSFGGIFRIDEDTGNIYTKTSLDHEEVEEYQLTVTAKDSAQVALSSHAKILVSVSDVNDNEPKITVNSDQDENNVIKATESKLSNQAVGHITVTDLDSGRNGQFTCTLDDNLFQMQHVFESEYKLVALQPLDRETRESYRVTISCVDMGVPPLSSDVTVDIQLVDINDHSPQFDREEYYLNIREDTVKGTSVYQVSASDLDIGNNGKITYSLYTDSMDRFLIDGDSGVIKTNDEFDYEKWDSSKGMVFHVLATDHGEVPLSSMCAIRLSIMDTNDEKPLFKQSPYTFSVPENEEPGFKLGRVSARDADSDSYNTFTFHLEGNSDTLSKFSIDEMNGNITTKAVLDREVTPIYRMKVVARDQSAPHWTTTVRVTVYVGDTNDNPPVIDFPNSTHDTLVTSSKNTVGTELGTILAHDKDEGQNSKLTYSIQSYNNHVPFSVHPITGKLKLTSKVYGSKTYTVTIFVIDNGNVPLSTEHQLIVQFNESLAAAVPPSNRERNFINTKGKNSSSGSGDHNIVLIIALSVVFTLIILALAALLVVLRCVRRKNQNSYSEESPDPSTHRAMLSRDFPEGKEQSPRNKTAPETRFSETEVPKEETEISGPKQEGKKAEKRQRISFTSVCFTCFKLLEYLEDKNNILFN